jgi:hypothetical protein
MFQVDVYLGQVQALLDTCGCVQDEKMCTAAWGAPGKKRELRVSFVHSTLISY